MERMKFKGRKVKTFNVGSKIVDLVSAGIAGIAIVALVVGVVGGIALFNGWIILLIWNNLLVALFDIKAITLLQGCLISLALGFVGGFFKSSSSSSSKK